MDDKTMRLYNAGLEEDEAVARGADRSRFRALEVKYKGGSIPIRDFPGTRTRSNYKPYSCDYHTGGKMGEQLRRICAQTRGA